jgi:hypothetical protein
VKEMGINYYVCDLCRKPFDSYSLGAFEVSIKIRSDPKQEFYCDHICDLCIKKFGDVKELEVEGDWYNEIDNFEYEDDTVYLFIGPSICCLISLPASFQAEEHTIKYHTFSK